MNIIIKSIYVALILFISLNQSYSGTNKAAAIVCSDLDDIYERNARHPSKRLPSRGVRVRRVL